MMGRYDWPGDPDPRHRDFAELRGIHSAGLYQAVPGALLADASLERAALLAASTTAFPDENLWIPIGPSCALAGQAVSLQALALDVSGLVTTQALTLTFGT